MADRQKCSTRSPQTGEIAKIAPPGSNQRQYHESILAIGFSISLPEYNLGMAQLRSPEHVCSFCSLVIQIGYENLTETDKAKIGVHMKIFHGLKPFEIPA
jgi:hypothetical protein